MKLPNHEEAYVQREKITEYLLSLDHAVGKGKAKFLRSHGFDMLNWRRLEQQLVSIAKLNDVGQEVRTQRGIKYVIDGLLHTPTGARVNLRTVWFVEFGQRRPRLITAYPWRSSDD